MDQNSIKALYSLAYTAYEAEQYSVALHYFRILTTVAADDSKYWMGFAACHQMMHKYDDAVGAYGIAAIMDEHNPEIHMHAAECFYQLNKRAEGKMALNSAKICINKMSDNKELLRQLALIRSKWDNANSRKESRV